MKVFGELTVSGTESKIAAALSAVTERLPSGWKHSAELESRSASPMRCFTRESSGEAPSAHLFLVQRGAGEWIVGNIIPVEVRELSIDQYNFVLNSFHTELLRPQAEKFALELEMGRMSKELEQFVSLAAARALRAFSDAANKSTGSAHPLDRARWCEFLVEASEDSDRDLDSEVLQRWLVEEAGWTEEIAGDLVDQYEFGLFLLDHQKSR